MCRHGKRGLQFVDLWEALYNKYVELGIGLYFPWPSCMCLPPSQYDHRKIQDLIEASGPSWADQVRSVSQKKSPAKVGKDTPENDDSAGRWYLITFTQPDTVKDPVDLLKRTQKVIRSKQVSAVQWCYSLELTERGIPHTHIRLFTNKYFDYRKVGSFNSGYRYDIQTEKFSSDKYVVKPESKPSESWLASYGLDTYFWCSDNYVGSRPDSLPDQDLISHV